MYTHINATQSLKLVQIFISFILVYTIHRFISMYYVCFILYCIIHFNPDKYLEIQKLKLYCIIFDKPENLFLISL